MLLTKSEPANLDTPDSDHRADRRLWLLCVGIGLLALVARLVYLVTQGIQIAPDSQDYLQLARSLVERHSFSMDLTSSMVPSIRRPPVYPVFLAIFGATSASKVAVAAVVQVFLDALVAAAVVAGARLVSSSRIAAAAGLLYALHPGAIANSVTMMSEALFAALLVAAVTAFVVAVQQKKVAFSILGGVLLGIAVLCRAIALPLPMLMPLCLLAFPKIGVRRSHAAALFLTVVAVVLPWALRTSRLAGQPVLVQGTSGVMVYIASRHEWNQLDQGEVWRSFDQDPEVRALNTSLWRLSWANTPTEIAKVDRALLSAAVARIKAAPVAYFKSRARILPYLAICAWVAPTPANATRVIRLTWQAARTGSRLLFSVLPLALALISLLRPRASLATLLCALIWLSTLALYFPMWIEPRYWLPVIPFLLVSAALGADTLSGMLRARLTPKLGSGASRA